jgi:glycosyltransferase involved in cell wall biosynthesis
VSKVAGVGLIGLIAAGTSGVPRYAASLIRALDRLAGEHEDVRLTLVTTSAGSAALEPRSLEVRVVGNALGSPRAGGRRVLGEQLASATERNDLLHYFDLTGPVLAPWRRFVSTVHDASQPRTYKRIVQPWAARHAQALVAVSGHARDEAIRAFGAQAGRIEVIHSGPGLELGASTGKPLSGATSPYLLYVGDLTEHKNLPFLVDVFAAAGAPERLVLAGRPGAGYDALTERIEASPARQRITVTLSPSDEELDTLYRGAVATVLPSLREGFGFTPLEAIARGCPVLASDLPALREVLDDGALLLPVGETDAWTAAVRRVAAEQSFRDELALRGGVVAARYSWERTARTVYMLFRRLLG